MNIDFWWISRTDKIRNIIILKKYCYKYTLYDIEMKQSQWYGHVQRMNEGRFKINLWSDNLKLGKIGVDPNELHWLGYCWKYFNKWYHPQQTRACCIPDSTETKENSFQNKNRIRSQQIRDPTVSKLLISWWKEEEENGTKM